MHSAARGEGPGRMPPFAPPFRRHHTFQVTCAEITEDRPRQPVYEIELMLSRVS